MRYIWAFLPYLINNHTILRELLDIIVTLFLVDTKVYNKWINGLRLLSFHYFLLER